MVHEPPALLKDDLGWLCAQTLTAYMRAAEPAVEDLPCGMRGYLVLAAAESACANNQLEVARRLGVDRSVMVGLLDNLERAGLVARQPNPTDRRERVIAITPAGRKRLATIQGQLEHVTAHVLAPLSAQQREGFLDALHTIVAHIAVSDRRPLVDECG
ncbi:MAG: regulatory protein MarR [Pseudonocardiales bacterium]|nr:regulatory protein MarR [Pseudonocardiales bacterium]